MGALVQTKLSWQQYLAQEREATDKSEFYQGEVFLMAGAGVAHNRINENLSGEFHAFLKGKSCQSFSRDMKLHIPANSLFTYPDLMVVCGKIEFLKEEEDVLLNPVLIVEILSKSTADYDRGSKFELYRQISTFKEYILLDSRRVKAEVWFKDPEWKLVQETSLLEDALYVHSIGMELKLTEAYRGTEDFIS
jgi:Uma2 family endonuclease